MHQPIRARGRFTARATAVVLGATALLFAGLPGLQEHADAAARITRCQDKYGTSPTPPPRSTLPGYRPTGPGQWSTTGSRAAAHAGGVRDHSSASPGRRRSGSCRAFRQYLEGLEKRGCRHPLRRQE
ncbi:hypothetical protein ACQ4WX_04875 [Streptomyces lasalocidi]